MAKPEFQEVWSRIVDHEGQVFHQIRGAEFTYAVVGNTAHAFSGESADRPIPT